MSELSNNDLNFMCLALEEAQRSPCKMKHGAIAVVKGHVIGRGYNHYRCNTRDGFVQDSCTCHAEIAAIRQAYHSADKSHTHFEHSIKVAQDTQVI